LEEACSKIKSLVSHFNVFGSVTWDQISDEKRKTLQSKSEKCNFVGYFENVKGYRLLQPHSNESIIRRDVKFDENILACDPNSTFVPSLTYDPYSTSMSYSLPKVLLVILF
jgi:hypothetical protein